jgi:serine/threonine protein kinase
MSSSAEAAAQAAAKAGSNVKRVGKYEIGRTLGEGTFGKVKYAVNTETGEKVRCTGQAGGEWGVVARRSAERTCSIAHTRLPWALLCCRRRAGGHQDPGQGEDPEAEHGRADQEGDLHHEDGQARPRRQAVRGARVAHQGEQSRAEQRRAAGRGGGCGACCSYQVGGLPVANEPSALLSSRALHIRLAYVPFALPHARRSSLCWSSSRAASCLTRSSRRASA